MTPIRKTSAVHEEKVLIENTAMTTQAQEDKKTPVSATKETSSVKRQSNTKILGRPLKKSKLHGTAIDLAQTSSTNEIKKLQESTALPTYLPSATYDLTASQEEMPPPTFRNASDILYMTVENLRQAQEAP